VTLRQGPGRSCHHSGVGRLRLAKQQHPNIATSTSHKDVSREKMIKIWKDHVIPYIYMYQNHIILQNLAISFNNVDVKALSIACDG
jgi:uncharacterized protein YqkB